MYFLIHCEPAYTQVYMMPVVRMPHLITEWSCIFLIPMILTSGIQPLLQQQIMRECLYQPKQMVPIGTDGVNCLRIN